MGPQDPISTNCQAQNAQIHIGASLGGVFVKMSFQSRIGSPARRTSKQPHERLFFHLSSRNLC